MMHIDHHCHCHSLPLAAVERYGDGMEMDGWRWNMVHGTILHTAHGELDPRSVIILFIHQALVESAGAVASRTPG